MVFVGIYIVDVYFISTLVVDIISLQLIKVSDSE